MRLLYNPPGSEAEFAIKSTTSLPAPISPEPELKEDRPCEVVIIDSQQAWDQALQEVKEAGICGLDLETTGLDPLVASVRLIQLAIPRKVFVADVCALGTPVLIDLARLIENEHVRKVIHNAKFELSMIQASQDRRFSVKNLFCTMLASQVCWSGYYHLIPASKATKFPWKKGRVEHNLEALAERHLGLKMDKSCQTSDWSAEILSPEQMQYAAKDAEVLLPLHKILQELLQKNNLEHIAELEFKALPAVVEIELTGLPIDSKATRSLMEAKRAEAQTLLQDLQQEALVNGYISRPKKGKKFEQIINPDSRMDVLGYLHYTGHKINSSKEEDLRALDYPWADKLLHYRRIFRQKKFLEDWLLRISPVDNRLHAQYFQCSTVSGRFSCRKPNAQQIPKRGG
jgi:DNA polymerase I